MVDVLDRVIAELQQLREQQKADDSQQLARSTAEFQAISDQQQNQLKEYERRIAELEQALTDKNNELSYKLALTLSLANVAHEALLVINEKRQIIAINDRAEELFGRERPIGDSLVGVTSSPELDMMVSDALTNAEESYEDQLVIKDRTYRVNVRVVRRDGNFFIGLALQDISDLVRLNRARRDMVANISHELRHPIANIMLTIDGLFHEHERPKRKQSINSLRAIARETDTLLWLVEELYDLSMIESGQAIMRMIPCTLRELVNEAEERIHDQAEAKDLKFANEVDSQIVVLCDRDQVRRVLTNLIHNSVKWSPEGETITVRAQDNGDEVTITVLDKGSGVPDDQVQRIFERFYQVDASRSVVGTGLGLAICKHIVEAHGGNIWAEGSSTAKGGHFAFTLLSTPDAPVN
jgi:two-component system, OmpR family, phosphate regulon sensor histidine kinase PhoR